MTSKMKLALFNARSLNKEQLNGMIAQIDLAIISMRSQMKNMGTQYKLKVAIPALRDFDTARKRIVAELNNRK